MTLYRCDPAKNTECPKTDCGWLNNGCAICFRTSKAECAAKDEYGKIIEDNMDDERAGDM